MLNMRLSWGVGTPIAASLCRKEMKGQCHRISFQDDFQYVSHGHIWPVHSARPPRKSSTFGSPLNSSAVDPFFSFGFTVTVITAEMLIFQQRRKQNPYCYHSTGTSLTASLVCVWIWTSTLNHNRCNLISSIADAVDTAEILNDDILINKGLASDIGLWLL